MSYSEFPIDKKIKTLLREISFYYCREWYDSILEEDIDVDDIEKAHELLNDQFAKTQIDSFFFTHDYQAVLFPAIALLKFFKFNGEFANYITEIYKSDEQLIDNLHVYFHTELEKRLEKAVLEENQENDETENCEDESEYYAEAAAVNNDIPFKLPKPWNIDKQINVISATIWNETLKIIFSDSNPSAKYFIRIIDRNQIVLTEFVAEPENYSENSKLIIVEDCSCSLFLNDKKKWTISRE